MTQIMDTGVPWEFLAGIGVTLVIVMIVAAWNGWWM
jgi:hypothetical protein